MNTLASVRMIRRLSQTARPLTRHAITKACLPSRIISSSTPLANGETVYSRSMPCSTIQTMSFSTTDETMVDLSTMSTAQLQQLALKYVRQDNPIRAQLILERLELLKDDGIDLSNVRTSVIDSWVKYQNAGLKELKESISTHEDINLRVQKGRLAEICHAAECASQIVDDMENPSSHHIIAILKAWANACEAAHGAGLTKTDFLRGVPQRTQHIVTLHNSTNEPSVELYNQVIKAWTYSGEHLRGTMAEQIFVKLENPNGETFKLMLRAWCLSKEHRCAFTATGHFMRMMRRLETGQSDMEPSMDDYHILFQAWATAEDKNAPSKVRNVMQIIENAYQNDSTDNRLDETCYRDALRTMSQRVNVPEVGELADATLAEMKDRMMIPDTTCYGAAVLAWKNVAMARECDDREKAVRRTMELLEEMTKAFHRTTTVTVKPTTENYNHVLEALTVSKSSKAPDRAEILLSALEGVLHEKVDENSEEEAHKTFENANVGPIAESYKHVLDILRNSKSGDKMNHAIDVLNRMKARRGVLQQSSTEESFVGVYSSFIRVCANSYVKDEEIRMKMMAMALRAVEDMRLEGLQPDSSTYTALLEAGHQLMSDGKDRQKVLENVFLRACEEGYVNQNFLELFKSSASTHLFSKLVVAHSREVEKMKVVPESWTRNVKGFVANVRGGRKVLPLSIEGKFTFTKAASEYKMRKLRMQHNRQMLQGGRTK